MIYIGIVRLFSNIQIIINRNVNKEMGIVRNSDSDSTECKITLEDESQESRWSSREPIFDKWPKPDTVRMFFYFFF